MTEMSGFAPIGAGEIKAAAAVLAGETDAFHGIFPGTKSEAMDLVGRQFAAAAVPSMEELAPVLSRTDANIRQELMQQHMMGVAVGVEIMRRRLRKAAARNEAMEARADER